MAGTAEAVAAAAEGYGSLVLVMSAGTLSRPFPLVDKCVIGRWVPFVVQGHCGRGARSGVRMPARVEQWLSAWRLNSGCVNNGCVWRYFHKHRAPSVV